MLRRSQTDTLAQRGVLSGLHVQQIDLIELPRLQHRADEAASLLRILANPDRLLLLCQLVGEECCVSDLEERTGIHQPTLSQQLGVLRNEGLVQTRRDGKRIYYTLAHPVKRWPC